MSVFTPTKGHKIFCVLLHDMLRFDPTFKDGFKDLILKRKSILFIANIGIDLSQISLDIHKYDFNLDAVLPPAPKSVSSPEGTCPPGT